MLSPPRAQVQRERFTRGLAEVLMTKAYDEVTVAAPPAVGGSRRTFYEYFDDKVDCLLAAYDDAAQTALRPGADIVRSRLAGGHP